MRRAAGAVAHPLAATGVHPNVLTLLGLALNGAAAAMLAAGAFTSGALVFLIASAFDTLDGALARVAGKASLFGAFLDSVADRYAEAVVLVGLLVNLHLTGQTPLLVPCAAALVGSLLVSYVRARAEGLGTDCEIGLFQRPERVVVLGVGLLLAEWLLAPALWLLAVGTNATVVQRALHVHRQLGSRGPGAPSADAL